MLELLCCPDTWEIRQARHRTVTEASDTCARRVATQQVAIVAHPSRRHRRPKLTARQLSMIEGISRGQTVAESARDAGYSSTSCKGTVYRAIKSTAIQRRIQKPLK